MKEVFRGAVRRLERADLSSLRGILETWIRWESEVLRDEVEETLRVMEESLRGDSQRTYFVACDEKDGRVVGVMGIRVPDERLLVYTRTDRPVELVNAFISAESRRRGVGRALVEKIEAEARGRGFKEIVLDSGPRYRFSGWGAWNRIFGQPVGVARDYYGQGYDAMVWRKGL